MQIQQGLAWSGTKKILKATILARHDVSIALYHGFDAGGGALRALLVATFMNEKLFDNASGTLNFCSEAFCL